MSLRDGTFRVIISFQFKVYCVINQVVEINCLILAVLICLNSMIERILGYSDTLNFLLVLLILAHYYHMIRTTCFYIWIVYVKLERKGYMAITKEERKM